ncbi:ABC transporter ATP-binding protein [Evansella halocellulosilytica]|uniref:ABC transporter ATP-binding protein n=1 Tax=Evansella halocellulosilytica TaxID=2011013 RepID=UPI000BB6E3BE|nr:ABC transporter ATP-binding protein [Evansella halocellulosilytica]
MSLSVEQVTRSFQGDVAVKNVSFEAEKGEIIGLLGTSGCGKSTILRAISGLDNGYEGTVRIDGNEKKSVTKELGIIFQEPRLMPWLTVVENVYFGLEGEKPKKIDRAMTLLKQVGLDRFAHYYPKQLSGGMAQRTAIARALVTEPSTLLLDEPFSALDAFTKIQLQNMLLDLWESYRPTMVLVTHDIDEALALCDRIVVLKGQPGVVYENITIRKAKPRSKTDIELTKIKEKILKALEIEKNADSEAKVAMN